MCVYGHTHQSVIRCRARAGMCTHVWSCMAQVFERSAV